MKHMKFTLTAVLGLFIVGGLSAQITIDTSIPSPGAGSVLGDASGDGVASWQAASGSGSGSGFWEGSQTGSINNTNSGNINVNSLLSCGYVETNERITRTGYAGTGITFGGADLTMRTAGANTLACYNGYVGINGYPATSGARLHVNGGARASGNITTDARVGVGTHEPVEALHVVGSSKLEGNVHVGVGTTVSCSYIETSERIYRTGHHGTSLAFGGADLVMRTAGSNTLACYNGYVGVNGYPSTSGAKLQVNGSCQATEFISGTTTYPDYVFEDDYKLMPLDELAAFIAEEGHLPKIATEKEVEAFGGVKLGELQIQLLEKVEELTLYTLQQEERIKAQQEAYDALKAQVESLQNN